MGKKFLISIVHQCCGQQKINLDMFLLLLNGRLYFKKLKDGMKLMIINGKLDILEYESEVHFHPDFSGQSLNTDTITHFVNSVSYHSVNELL